MDYLYFYIKIFIYNHTNKGLPLLKELKFRQVIRIIFSAILVSFESLNSGISFCLIFGIPTYFGVYSSVMPAIIYSIFGTAKNLSIGNL
jgi:MFS superfamily sulfate permease-like transporter